MAVFQNSEQLYSFFRLLIDRIEADDAKAAESMLKSGMRFQFKFTDLDAELMIDARKRPLKIEYGASTAKPDLEVALTSDTLDEILRGKITLTKALGSKKLKPKGPVWKTAVLADLFNHAKTIYQPLLTELK